MGLGVCTSLAESEQGKQELQVAGQKFVGGLWSFVFTVLLDDMECGFVRQQVCNISVWKLKIGKRAWRRGSWVAKAAVIIGVFWGKTLNTHIALLPW